MLKALFEEAGAANDGLVSDDDEPGKPKIITAAHFIEFLARNFDLNDYSRGTFNLGTAKTKKRIKRMVETFFVDGHGLDPKKLSQRDLTYGFREKVELKIPIAIFFHVGINACIDYENDEN